jgi:periplasmic copper chaperone A
MSSRLRTSRSSAPQASARRIGSRHALLLAATCAGLLGVAACGGSQPPAAVVASGSSSVKAASVITIKDQWVKTADSEMTATFGTLVNSGSSPIKIVSAKTSASDRTELHEVTGMGDSMTMRPVADGLTVPAGGTLELKPGSFHIMIMNLKDPIESGDEVDVRLTFADGSTRDYQALAKETAAGEENYETPAAS